MEFAVLPTHAFQASHSLLSLTCIRFKIFWCHHDHKSNCPLIPEHFIGPSANGAHAFNSSNAIVGYENLGNKKRPDRLNENKKQQPPLPFFVAHRETPPATLLITKEQQIGSYSDKMVFVSRGASTLQV